MFERLNLIFLLLALLAEVIGTVGGFGSSVFFVPLGNFYFNFHTVLGMTALFHLSSNLSKIALFRKGFNKRLILMLGVPSIIFVVLGGWLSDKFDPFVLTVILGVFLIIFSLLFILRPRLELKDGNPQAIGGGALSGLLAGLLGTGGAIRGLTMAAFNLEKSVFIATSAIIDFAVDLSRTFVYWANGFIDGDVIFYFPFLFVIGFIGTFIGKKLLKFIPQQRFRTISLVLILIIGVVTLFTSFK